MNAPRSSPLSDSPAGQLRRLLDRASDELERCLRGGEACRVEDLLARYSQLAEHPPFVLDLIALEFVLRQQLGQTPSLADYCARFPQWREGLESRLPMLSETPTSGWAEMLTVQEPRPATDPAVTLSRNVALRRLGHYQLLERIGHGGMGDVYRARQCPPLERIVALKLLRTGDEFEVRTFTKEIEVARRMRHANLLPIYDAGCIDGEYYYTMPLLSGGSLEKRLRREPADPRWTVELLEKVARAVHFAHQQGVLHRDLKPANILLDERDEPLVADFGLAKLLDSSIAQTQTGQLLGSVPYMSPEQASGQGRHATPASDVWSLGVILYEMLTGQRPFRGPSHSEILTRIQRVEPLRPRQLQADVPPELEAICLKCLEKDPAWRYGSAEELADDLKRWLDGIYVSQPSHRLADRLRRHLARRSTWRPQTLIALASLLLGGLCSLLFAWLPPSKSPQTVVPPVESIASRSPAHILLAPGISFPPNRQEIGHGALRDLPRQAGIVLNSFTFYMLEIVPPDSRRQGYKLTVEMQQVDLLLGGRGGIYFGRQLHATDSGIVHSFAQIGFAEPRLRQRAGEPVVKKEADNAFPLGLTLGCYCLPRKGEPRPLASADVIQLPLQPAPRQQDIPHRTFVLEVTSEQVLLSVGGRNPQAFSLRELVQTTLPPLQAINKELRNLTPTIATTGGIGIWIQGGEIELRRIQFEPLSIQK